MCAQWPAARNPTLRSFQTACEMSGMSSTHMFNIRFMTHLPASSFEPWSDAKVNKGRSNQCFRDKASWPTMKCANRLPVENTI